jgi:hypothetical protein
VNKAQLSFTWYLEISMTVCSMWKSHVRRVFFPGDRIVLFNLSDIQPNLDEWSGGLSIFEISSESSFSKCKRRRQ